MVKCPNCGQETSGGDCQWCNYPILKGRQEEAKRAKMAEKQAKRQEAIDAREKARQAAIDAREKARQEAKETRRTKAAKEAEKQAAIDAREKAKQEAKEAKEARKQTAIEARRARIAEKRAEKQAAIDAREKAKQEAEEQAAKEAARVLLSQIDSDQAKHLEECLKELKNTREELGGGKIGAEEATQRLRNISERISK